MVFLIIQITYSIIDLRHIKFVFYSILTDGFNYIKLNIKSRKTGKLKMTMMLRL